MKNIKTFISWLIIFTFLFGNIAFATEKIHFYHTDPTGTPLVITDQNGYVVWEADYMPFGEEHNIPVSDEQNNRRFVGKEKDAETGFNYFGARYYKSEIGRFLAIDPVGPVDPFTNEINGKMLSNPQRLNPYAYGLNNPYSIIDPDGRDTYGIDVWFSAGKGFVATAGNTWVIDDKGNIARIRHAGGGAMGGIEASGGVYIQKTNAPSVDELAGVSTSIGGSVGKGPTLGGEEVLMNNGFRGQNYGAGYSVGPIPVEMHAVVENSEVIWKRNIIQEAVIFLIPRLLETKEVSSNDIKKETSLEQNK